MCKSTQDLTIWLNQVAQHLQLEADDISIQIFADKSFRLYVPQQEEPIYDSETGQWVNPMDINDVLYQDPIAFATYIKELLSDASSEERGVLSAEELLRAS
jgi:hypothetical protein